MCASFPENVRLEFNTLGALAPLAGLRPVYQQVDKQAQITAALAVVEKRRGDSRPAGCLDFGAVSRLGERNLDDLTPGPQIAADKNVYATRCLFNSRKPSFALHDGTNFFTQHFG